MLLRATVSKQLQGQQQGEPLGLGRQNLPSSDSSLTLPVIIYCCLKVKDVGKREGALLLFSAVRGPDS